MANLRKRKNRRRWWRTNLFNNRHSTELLRDLKFQEVSGKYKNFATMTPTDFENLIQKITSRISKMETNFRRPITAQDRLALTLPFLATGNSYTSLQYLFPVSKQSIGQITQVCSALIQELKENVKLPTDPMDWLEVCKVFEGVWNLPHCVGAIDGKHVILQSPFNSGSDFFNYKSQFSIVLLALVDGNYNFMFADVGCQGRISDGGVFKHTVLQKMMTENTLRLPPPIELPGRQKKIPYYFAADSAFVLGENIMKGNHAKGSLKRIFNYRLSRARTVVENAFGISAVFRVLRKPILVQPDKAQLIVLAITHLHNYLRKHSPNVYTPNSSLDYEENGIVIPGSWQNEPHMASMISFRNVPKRSAAHINAIRDEISEYCVKEGVLSWQSNYA